MKVAEKHFKGWCQYMEFKRMPSEVKEMLKEAFKAGFVSGVCNMEKEVDACATKLLDMEKND
jgi:hypothetical protein